MPESESAELSVFGIEWELASWSVPLFRGAVTSKSSGFPAFGAGFGSMLAPRSPQRVLPGWESGRVRHCKSRDALEAAWNDCVEWPTHTK